MAVKGLEASNAKPSRKKTAKKKTTEKQAGNDNWTRPDDWLIQSEAAELCRVSVTMFQRYELNPIERRGRHTYYTRDQVLDFIDQRAHRKGFEAGLREGKSQTPADLADVMAQKNQAELEFTRERAEGQRLKNAQMRRELAPVEMVQWALSQAGSQIAAVLGTIKGKVKRAQPGMTNAALHEVEQIAVEVQNIAADIHLDWDDFDATDYTDPRSN